jgi:hypothetical protein
MSELVIKLSPAAFEEVRHALKIQPGYERFKVNAVYFELKKEPAPTPHASAKERKKLRAGKPTL